MASAIQAIAGLLSMDEQEAERFFREVQANFQGEVPEDGFIVQVIRDHQTDGLTPEDVARISEKKLKTKAGRAATSRGTPGGSQADRNADLDLNHGVQSINTLGRRGDPRAARASLDKCPHGVSRGQKCHICNRDNASNR